jgi:hypothetical protein
VTGSVPQDLPLSRHVVRGQQVQLASDQGAGVLQVLAVHAALARGDVLLGVDHIHRAAVG